MRTIKRKSKFRGGDKNNRWTRNKKFYESKKITSCVGIKSLTQLEEKLTTNFKNKYSLNNEIENINFYLFPYCSEKNKLEKAKSVQSVDKVNSSEIEYNVLSIFSRIFKYNFEYDNINLISTKKNIIKPAQDYKLEDRATKFVNYLHKYNFNNKNGAFIVSHSKFMSEFIKEASKLIKNNTEDNTDYSFDNYDILELVYKNHSLEDAIPDNRLYSIKIRRYDNDYNETDKSIIKEIQIPENESKNKKHLFLMRHCLGCHNIEPGIINKGKRVLQGEEGFLKYAMCLEDAFCMLSNKRKSIIKFLHDSLSPDKKNAISKEDPKYDDPVYINKLLDEYQFGSSIIYRAILTSILLVFSLSKQLKDENLETCNNFANKILNLEGRFEALEL